MIFRGKNNKIIIINRNNFINDNEYYNKIIEVKFNLKFNDKKTVIEKLENFLK
tara:strand:+ start:422 stop:580 length:159 start_codon:yes stop_codon:yes gene_type:complete